jgi:hypothetical protein
MKNFKWAALCLALSACGGGSGGSAGSGGTPVSPAPPPPPPAPSVSVLSGTVTRIASSSSGISFDVLAKPSFSASAFYATATDKDGLVTPNVAVNSNSDGTFTLSVDTKAALVTGHYKGDLTLKLCSDAACTTALAVPSVTVPYDITVLERGSAWPGDNLKALAAWTDVADWSTFQGNPGHTGYVPVTLKPDQFSLRWKTGPVSAAAPNNFGYGYANTVAAAKGVLYGGGDNKLKAIRESDGSVAWTYDFSSLKYPSVNPPAVADGVVYMAAGQQDSTFMFGFDASTGAVRFKSPMSSQWENYLAPVALDNTVYTNAGTYGGLYGFASSGEQLFFKGLTMTSMWSPAADATSVYAYIGNLVTLDRKTGQISSTITDPDFQNYTYQMNGSVVLGAPGNAFAANYAVAWLNGGTMGNSLLKFNVARGFLDWRVAGNFPVTPGYADGVVYALNTKPYRVEARAEADGALLWSWTPPIAGEAAWGAEPLVTKNLLFVSTDKATYAIDMHSHKPVWSYPASGRLALTQSGVLYIQNNEALVAVNVK